MFSNLPPVTKALLIANGLVFLLQLMLGDAALAQFMLWPPMGSDDPYAYTFLPWQVLTYGFMHGGWAHLLFNMLALAMFGAPLEHVWGQRRYLTYYLVCVVGAARVPACRRRMDGEPGRRSLPHGGRIGRHLRIAAGLRHAVPEPARDAADSADPDEGAHAGDRLRRDRTAAGHHQRMPGVAHFAHLGGMFFGWLLIRYWRGQPPFGRKGPPRMRVVR